MGGKMLIFILLFFICMIHVVSIYLHCMTTQTIKYNDNLNARTAYIIDTKYLLQVNVTLYH